VNNEEGKNYKRLKNELNRTTEKAKKEYLVNIRNETMEVKRAGRHAHKGNTLERKPWDSKHWH
jgi:hypothetical protein